MTTEVHIDWRGETHFVGRLHMADRGQAVTFEYASEWLERADAFSIDPTALPLRLGAYHSAALFGAFQDCGPDRWGRLLIERAVRKQVLASKPFRDLDYVLALEDFSRIGALRFREEGFFLAEGDGKLPPMVKLQALLRATEAIHSSSETAADLRFLLGAGSPLGGARPKSAILLPDGQLGIAKFPKPDDTRDIAAGETLALSLAAAAGIQTAGHRLIAVGSQSVAVITRFDREGDQRIPFLSANSLLGLSPGDAGAYTILADGIRQFGDEVGADLRELWRRLVFSLLVSNYDDHMRNHAFLLRKPGHWALSPAYDINPVPEIDRSQVNKTAISEDQAEPSIEGALAVAGRFGLKSAQATMILGEVLSVVSEWKKVGKKLRLSSGTLQSYASAFEHPLIDEARRLLLQ